MWDHSPELLHRLCSSYWVQAEWNKAIQFLKDQGEERLELERNLLLQPPKRDPSLVRAVAAGLTGGNFGRVLVLCL